MLINGTVLGVAPIRTSLLLTCGLLAGLFTVMKPEISAGLNWAMRFIFWVLHIGVGLGAILLASYLLRGWSKTVLPVFWGVTLTGVNGAIISAPLYLALDALFPAVADDGWLDQWAATGWWQGVLVEFIEVLPVLLLSWYAVNIPLFFNKPRLLNGDVPPDDPNDPTSEENEESEKAEQRRQVIEDLYSRLPEVIGSDVVAISSDLHYLNVHTLLGKALILGSLKHYVEAFAEQGILVHRSHWVAKAHVEKIHIAGDTATCLMATGLQVPISRSKRKEVKECFGSAARQLKQERPLSLVRP